MEKRTESHLEAGQLLAGERGAWTLLVVGLVLWLFGAAVAGSWNKIKHEKYVSSICINAPHTINNINDLISICLGGIPRPELELPFACWRGSVQFVSCQRKRRVELRRVNEPKGLRHILGK